MICTVSCSIIINSQTEQTLFNLLLVRIAIGLIVAILIRNWAIKKNRFRPNRWFAYGIFWPIWTLLALWLVEDRSKLNEGVGTSKHQKALFDLGNQNSSGTAPKSSTQGVSNRCKACNSLMAPTMKVCPKCKKQRELTVISTL